jgi:hypothetical protein
LSIDPLGDQRDAGRLTIPLTSGGVVVDLVLDVVFVRVGRTVDLILFLNTFSPFDEEVRGDLTSATVRRLSAALDG